MLNMLNFLYSYYDSEYVNHNENPVYQYSSSDDPNDEANNESNDDSDGEEDIINLKNIFIKLVEELYINDSLSTRLYDKLIEYIIIIL